MSYTDSTSSDSRNAAAEPPRSMSRWAIASLVSAILAPVFFCACVPTILVSLAAVIMGHIALFSISGSEGRRSGSLLAIGGLVIGYPVLIISAAMAPTFFQTISDLNNPSTPRGALNQLEDHITSGNKGTFHGNNEEAEKMAEAFSEGMGALRDIMFGKQEFSEFSLTKGEFVTYCELRHDRCLFLVHVPDYRNFNNDEKELLANLAWSSAEFTAREKLPKGAKLAVGLRGILQYGAVMTGEVVAKDDDEILAGRKTNTTESDDLFPFVQPLIEQVAPPAND